MNLLQAGPNLSYAAPKGNQIGVSGEASGLEGGGWRSGDLSFVLLSLLVTALCPIFPDA